MQLQCPACADHYEDNFQERLIPINGWTYNVCPTCFAAYLKVRVTKGERLDLTDLNRIGKVRNKVKKATRD